MKKTLNISLSSVFAGACLATLGLACSSSSSSPPASSGGAPGQSATGGMAQTSGTGGAATSSSGGAAVSTSGGAPGSGGQASLGTGGDQTAGTGGAVANGGGSGAGGRVGAAGGNPGSAGTTGGGGQTTGGGGQGTSNLPIMAGGDSKCATPMVAIGSLCDGFEGPAIGAAGSPFMADAVGAGSTAVVDTTKAYRGTKSAHLKMSTSRAFITETGTFNQMGTAATNNDMWGRIFIWFEAAASPGGHTVFIRLEDPALSGMSKELHLAGENEGTFGAEIRTTSDLWKMGTVKYPLATPRWECWEWHTSSTNALEFYIDGKIMPAMTVTAANNWPFPTFKKLSLGFLSFRTGNNATETWIDEVAVGTNRIGCDN